MKKMMLALAAVFALSHAAPAFAEDKADAKADAKPAKKGKKGKKDEAKKEEAK